MKVGVFGGTFDPPHVGHILTAVDALEQLALDQVIVIPNAQHPTKGAAQATAGDRFEMVRRMCSAHDRLLADPIEVARGGISYTYQTIEEVASRYAAAELYFLAGADVVAHFGSFRNPERVLRLARLAALTRSGELPVQLESGLRDRCEQVQTRRIDVSSSEVRDRVAAGLPIRGFVLDAVADFIEEMGLYVKVK